MNKIYYIIMLVFVGMLVIAGYIFFVDDENEINTKLITNINTEDIINIANTNTLNTSETDVNEVSNVNNELDETKEPPVEETVLIEPVNEFKERITKKPFGIYVTPANSPVQPENFNGYHTGVDVEYEDVDDVVIVRAVTAGKVVSAKWVSGYGGVLILRHEINGEELLVLYGHLDPDLMITINAEVLAGQQIGVLGEGGTNETDGERKHLHLSFIKGTEVNLRGYVSSESELNAWYDPLDFY